ncbi:F-box/WD-40 repeat-containing protein At3g52030 isoform X2 [Aristolochia californica]|uniref:F-box/WD-40 repeat-containing protein At3g52030 isoform X2 n=1 Tax=Aristolochia californica TaxID=171875 RepID=UPI0035E1A3C9
MEGKSRRLNSATVPATPIHFLGPELLCSIFASLNHFDLVRCSAVCKSWHKIINSSNLFKELYFKQSLGPTISVPSDKLLKEYFEDLAMEQHKVALVSGSVEVHRWKTHSVGINQCRMKTGLIVTGGGDKVVRLWSSESYKCLGEYSVPRMSPLIDFDFDESKIVGLIEGHLCIWRRQGKRSIFPSKEGTFSRGLCMRMHSGSITCLALTDDQMIVSGSSLGSITVAGLSFDQRVGYLRTSTALAGIRTLSFNQSSYSVYAGSTNGYCHCWDLRTMKPLWEKRVSPNVVYSVHHMDGDKSALVVGGIDGILRILDKKTGELLASYVAETSSISSSCSNDKLGVMGRKQCRKLTEDTLIDDIPRQMRPSITCVAVGMKKVVTTHNEKYTRVWKFDK